jgi:hypothetical protein
MGLVPILPPPRNPAKWGERRVAELEKHLAGRRSRFGWRRRRARRACLELIRHREASIERAAIEIGRLELDIAVANVRTLRVKVGAREDRCSSCGIERRYAGYLRETCGDGLFTLDCFVLPTGVLTGGGGCLVAMPAARKPVELVSGDGRTWTI